MKIGKDNPICFAWHDDKQRKEASRPQVVVCDRQLRDVADDVLNNLLTETEDQPVLFVRDAKLVGISDDGKGVVKIAEHNESSIKALVGQYSDFVRISRDKDGNEIQKDVFLPKDVSAHLISSFSKDHRIPALQGIVTAPVVGRNGDVECEQGYLPNAEVYFAAPEGKLEICRYKVEKEDVQKS